MSGGGNMKYSSLKTPSIIFLILILGIVTPIVCASMGSNYGKFRRVEDAVVDTQTGDIAFGYSTGNGFVVEVYSSDGNRLFFKNLNAYGGVIRLCYQDGSLYVKAGRENIRPKFDRSGEVVSYGEEPEGGFAYDTFDGWAQENGNFSFRLGATVYRYSESSTFTKCFAGKGVNRLYLVKESGEEIELFRNEGR